MVSNLLQKETRQMEMHIFRAGKKLEANNKTGEIVTLQYIQANEAMLMFGLYLAPDSNNKDQFKYIPKRETTWATSIRVWGI